MTYAIRGSLEGSDDQSTQRGYTWLARTSSGSCIGGDVQLLGRVDQNHRRRELDNTDLIPAAESGLLGSAETPVAIVLAWIILSETPPVASMVGALIVLATVLMHARSDFKSIARSPPASE